MDNIFDPFNQSEDSIINNDEFKKKATKKDYMYLELLKNQHELEQRKRTEDFNRDKQQLIDERVAQLTREQQQRASFDLKPPGAPSKPLLTRQQMETIADKEITGRHERELRDAEQSFEKSRDDFKQEVLGRPGGREAQEWRENASEITEPYQERISKDPYEQILELRRQFKERNPDDDRSR